MTPKELYEWAVENQAEDFDVLINGVAMGSEEPSIDYRIGAIDITTPYMRW